MTEREYARLTEALFHHLGKSLDAYADEVEYEMPGDGIIEIEFEDRSKIVVNRQAAVQEIWVAARSGGFHYRWQEGAWRDTRGGEELLVALSRLATAQAGVGINLNSMEGPA